MCVRVFNDFFLNVVDLNKRDYLGLFTPWIFYGRFEYIYLFKKKS